MTDRRDDSVVDVSCEDFRIHAGLHQNITDSSSELLITFKSELSEWSCECGSSLKLSACLLSGRWMEICSESFPALNLMTLLIRVRSQRGEERRVSTHGAAVMFTLMRREGHKHTVTHSNSQWLTVTCTQLCQCYEQTHTRVHTSENRDFLRWSETLDHVS